MPARSFWLVLWMAGGLGLIYLMLRYLGVSLVEVLAALREAPIWMYVSVTVLTFANQIVGALKWRTAARWLATEKKEPSLFQMVETTSVGSFFGQIIPPQISAVMARWIIAQPEERRGGWAVKSTIFEQMFDLLVLVCAGLAGLSMFMLHVSGAAAVGVVLLSLVVGLAGLRIGLGVGWRLCLAAARLPIGQALLLNAADSFAHAYAAPRRVSVKLSLWSLLRLLLLALRAVVIAVVFAPAASPLLVAAGYPAVGLIAALPITPAGLGVMEWSWSGVLIASGAAAPNAAIAALGLRLVSLVSLTVIMALFAVLRLLRLHN